MAGRLSVDVKHLQDAEPAHQLGGRTQPASVGAHIGGQPARGPGKLAGVAHDGERGQRVHQRQRHALIVGRQALHVQVAQFAWAPQRTGEVCCSESCGPASHNRVFSTPSTSSMHRR